MDVNQVGAGGLQNVNLYRQNQGNTSLPAQESVKKTEEVGGVTSFKVELSQEAMKLSKPNQGSGVESQKKQQTQKIITQQAQTIETSMRQPSAASGQPQAKIDLFA